MLCTQGWCYAMPPFRSIITLGFSLIFFFFSNFLPQTSSNAKHREIIPKRPCNDFFWCMNELQVRFKGVLETMGCTDSKTPLQKKKLQCLIVEKNHFNVVDWHCVFNVVDLPWELKEKKNKKKKYMGHLALASRTVTKQNIGLLVHGSMLISFFRNRGFWQIWKGWISLKNMANWRDLRLQKFPSVNISLQAIFVAIW